MVNLRLQDGPHSVLDLSAHKAILELTNSSTLEEELDAMIVTLRDIEPDLPDQIIVTCMAFMARCTEMYVQLIRNEFQSRWMKPFRTLQLQKVMELVDFTYKGASRLVESRRQEVELSR
jgi:hypothetical protein